MAKQDTIENRVYLFESLASSYVSAAADLIGSDDQQARARAMQALADLAYVSCVMADGGAKSAEAVRDAIAGAKERSKK